MIHLSTEETQIVVKSLRMYENSVWESISDKENRALFDLIAKFKEEK